MRRMREKHARLRRCNTSIRMATWNMRGLGVTGGETDQEIKVKVLLTRMAEQQWDIVCLTDLQFPEDGIREYHFGGREWFLLVRGMVGFLLSDVWYDWWEQGGGVVYQRRTRAAAISIPRRGWRRGLWICSVYAPTSASGVRERTALRQEVSVLVEAAPPTTMVIIAGDFNAEMGNNVDVSRSGHSIMGPFAGPKVTKPGAEWRDWCERNGFREAGSRFKQRRRCTWRHPRYRSDHELDHFLVREQDLWHLQSCRILYDGPSVKGSWTGYTDHNPVECVLRVGKWWRPKKGRRASKQNPDLAKLRGSGGQAKELRERWQGLVESRLRDLRQELDGTVDETYKWERVCEVCRGVALEVCGVVKDAGGSPWLQLHAKELQELDDWIREAQLRDAAAGEQEYVAVRARFRRRLHEARRCKRLSVRGWKEDWLRERAQEADALIGTPEAHGVFKIVKQLLAAIKGDRRGGGRVRSSGKEELEAWKDHFEAIQAGRGQVTEAVWGDVEDRPEEPGLADFPTWEEMLRAIRDMKYGKAGGVDGMVAEYFKWAGRELHERLFEFLTFSWRSATRADAGREAELWPEAWRVGIVVPIWKRKGNWKDKNSWRGITLLSVGSKVLARICAHRLARWTQPWLNALQFGFRPGSGVDDIQQITRGVLEEAAHSAHDRVYLFRFYDLEKAYPKVARGALWKALEKKGCPMSFLQVLRGIHEDPKCKVRHQGRLSSTFVPERGLREGCPSSPILFNVYHHCVMEVFRARRSRRAEQEGQTPGLNWVFKVDGKVGKRRLDRIEEGRNIKRVCLGDFAYADDTGIMGEAAEVRGAENVLVQTIRDFEGKVNQEKTEGLRVMREARPGTDVPWLGEAGTVKHVGAMLAERAGHAAETHKRAQKAAGKVSEVSGAWLRGRTKHYARTDISVSTRIKVLKAIIKGTLMSFARTRAWQTNQINRVQGVIHIAIRRCLGYRLRDLRKAGITNEVLRNLAQWEKFDTAVRRASLLWLGHVARMPVEAPQKQVLFGWIDGHGAKMRCPFKQAQWLNSCLRHAGIPEMDWFRKAQNRSKWREEVCRAFPVEVVLQGRERELDKWRLGRPVPEWATVQGEPEPEREHECSEDELGIRLKGHAPGHETQMYKSQKRRRRLRTDRRAGRGQGKPTCPVCQKQFGKFNQLSFHYEAEHAICDPTLTTVQSFTCQTCQETFRRAGQLKGHVCPAVGVLERMRTVDTVEDFLGWEDAVAQPPLPQALHVYTDGSGGSEGGTSAGWGVAVFGSQQGQVQTDMWREADPWLAALYGPVLTQVYDKLWLGATEHTNNTGELSAIGEACRYLMDLHERMPPEWSRTVYLYYDSEYAYGVATRLTRAQANQVLAETVAGLVSAVRRLFVLHFKHVKGHSANRGNEIADALARRGAMGRVSPHCARWIDHAVPALHGKPRGAGGATASGKAKPKARPKRTPSAKPKGGAKRAWTGHEVGTCRSCSREFRLGDLAQHEPVCRGGGDANLRCRYCPSLFGSIGARKNHERYSHANEALRDGVIGKLSKRRTGISGGGGEGSGQGGNSPGEGGTMGCG